MRSVALAIATCAAMNFYNTDTAADTKRKAQQLVWRTNDHSFTIELSRVCLDLPAQPQALGRAGEIYNAYIIPFTMEVPGGQKQGIIGVKSLLFQCQKATDMPLTGFFKIYDAKLQAECQGQAHIVVRANQAHVRLEPYTQFHSKCPQTMHFQVHLEY